MRLLPPSARTPSKLRSSGWEFEWLRQTDKQRGYCPADPPGPRVSSRIQARCQSPSRVGTRTSRLIPAYRGGRGAVTSEILEPQRLRLTQRGKKQTSVV